MIGEAGFVIVITYLVSLKLIFCWFLWPLRLLFLESRIPLSFHFFVRFGEKVIVEGRGCILANPFPQNDAYCWYFIVKKNYFYFRIE